MADANRIIGEKIVAGGPAMIGRLGNTELSQLVAIDLAQDLSPIVRFQHLVARRHSPEWGGKKGANLAKGLEGRKALAHEFLDQYKEAMRQVDLLGSWAKGESHFSNLLAEAEVCNLRDLEPYYHDQPWSQSLAGKRVLVVHPFKKSIESQYRNNRELLFNDQKVLPMFNLEVVQSYLPGVRELKGGNYFFPVLSALTDEISRANFDVAIIGTGPTGFLLAAQIKRMGKVAIHLGGATQLLFGIRGSRWESQDFHFFNEAWVRPLPEETPQNFREILDNGAYW
jgi:hypothetical protein